MRTIHIAVACLAVLGAGERVHAALVTIDFTPSSPTFAGNDGQFILSDGFRFTLDEPRGTNAFLTVTTSTNFPTYGNILFNANDARFEMSADSGSTFDLLSFEFARRFGDTADNRSAEVINVIGNLAGGGTVTYTTAPLLDPFTTAILPSTFTNLTSVLFDPVQNSNGGSNNYEFLIDNINVQAPSAAGAVPEPATLAMWGVLGLVGAAYRRRKRA